MKPLIHLSRLKMLQISYQARNQFMQSASGYYRNLHEVSRVYKRFREAI